MAYRLKLAEYRAMLPQEREAELAALARAAQNGEGRAGKRHLDARIREYERRYEMSSDELRNKLAHGEARETAEIATWLFLLGARDCQVAG